MFERLVVCEGDTAFALGFHPTRPLLAVGLITGQVRIYDCSNKMPSKLISSKPHKEACRDLHFSSDGANIFSVGADQLLHQRDIETNTPVWRKASAHNTAINAVTPLAEMGVVTGDDDGMLKLWDTRQRKKAMEFKEHSDFISKMLFVPEKQHSLAVASGDGCLSVFDLRRGRLSALSDNQEDELLSLALVKGGKKLLCGTQLGVAHEPS